MGTQSYRVRSVHGGRIQYRTECEAYTAGVNPRPTVQPPTVCVASHARRHFIAKARPNFRYRLLATKQALVCVLRKFTARQTKSSTFVIARALRLLIHRKRSPLSRLRTRSSFGSNNPVDCYSLPKLPLRYLTREGIVLSPLQPFSLTPCVNISNCEAIYRVRSTYRICFACKANISRLAMRGISNPTKWTSSAKRISFPRSPYAGASPRATGPFDFAQGDTACRL